MKCAWCRGDTVDGATAMDREDTTRQPSCGGRDCGIMFTVPAVTR